MIVDDVEKKIVKLIPGAQYGFVTDDVSPFKAFVGGMDAAKTFSMALWMIRKGGMVTPVPGLFVEPDYSLIESAAIPAFEAACELMDLATHYNNRRKKLTIGVGRHDAWDVWMRSGDSPQKIVGFAVGYAGIDEPGLMRRMVLDRVTQRVRHKGMPANQRQIGLGGTPEGFNWFYDVCEGSPLDGMRVYRAKSTDNPYSDGAYIANLRATLSEQQCRAYIGGEFVNLTAGTVYSTFSRREHHRTARYDGRSALVVGCDFNVGKMCWVIGVRQGDSVHIIDEVIGLRTNTYRQSEALKERLVDIVLSSGAIHGIESIVRSTEVYTDATGERDQTSASASDVAILRSAGFAVMEASSNPRIRNRVATVESRFRLGALTVDADRCPELTKAIEQQAYGPDGLPQKGQGDRDLSGSVDALGYLLWGHPRWRAVIPTGNERRFEMRSYT